MCHSPLALMFIAFFRADNLMLWAKEISADSNLGFEFLDPEDVVDCSEWRPLRDSLIRRSIEFDNASQLIQFSYRADSISPGIYKPA